MITIPNQIGSNPSGSNPLGFYTATSPNDTGPYSVAVIM